MSTPLTLAQTQAGALSGATVPEGDVARFLGVRYAAPPVGALRWRPPEPPPPWQGVRAADSYGPISVQHRQTPGTFYQREFFPADEPQSEDCLSLNVWTAAESADERRPVMVWFHGGAFVEGSGSTPSFYGAPLARRGVVLVTVNYRLGALGFLAHPLLSAESGRGVSGNYALLDQIAALRWVRDNIAAFGGDPGRVTIFGQSAGSRSVNLLLCSPLAQGLFHRAIAQSGSAFSFRMQTPTLADLEREGEAIAARWGARTLAELRALPTAALLETPALYRSSGYRPGIDGWAIPESPERAIAEGRAHRVPLLLGCTSDELTTLLGDLEITAEQFTAGARERYGALADELLRHYPAEPGQSARAQQIALGSDQFFAGMRAWARMAAASQPGQVYLYRFERRPPGFESERYGAFHSSELVYVFGTLDTTARPWEPADRRLAEQIGAYWAGFASAGAPEAPGLPAWPPYDPALDQVMILAEQLGLAPAPRQAVLPIFDRDIGQRIAALP